MLVTPIGKIISQKGKITDSKQEIASKYEDLANVISWKDIHAALEEQVRLREVMENEKRDCVDITNTSLPTNATLTTVMSRPPPFSCSAPSALGMTHLSTILEEWVPLYDVASNAIAAPLYVWLI